MIPIFISFLFLVTSKGLISAFDWKDGDGGRFKWDNNCQFAPDNEIIVKPSKRSGADCGLLCWTNTQCTHFTYLNGSCHLKSLIIDEPAQYLANASCGWIVKFPWKVLHFEEGSVQWAQGCNFFTPSNITFVHKTQGLEDCAKICLRTNAEENYCTHFAYLAKNSTCQIKTVSKFVMAQPIDGADCGFVLNRTSINNSNMIGSSSAALNPDSAGNFLSIGYIAAITIPLVIFLILLAVVGSLFYWKKVV